MVMDGQENAANKKDKKHKTCFIISRLYSSKSDNSR